MHKLTAHDAETQSLDLVADNIAKLGALFPEILTEGADGGKRLDLEALRELLGDAVEDKEERYNFTWHGKAQARRLAQTPSTGTLRPCPAESKQWDSTQNLFIEGDNLEVLKLLQKPYHQRVKMIYIDPPYNTGKDFIYPDNYRDNIGNYLELTGQVEDGRKLGTNTETSGRYHTNWLNMMYPRLKLARNLLREDGVIFISIDERELQNLKFLCNEVFGEENFVAAITVLCNPKGRSQDKYFATNHEYILVFSKTILPKGYFAISKDNDQIEAEYPEEDDGGKFRLLELRNTHREFGKHNRRNLWYPFFVDDAGNVYLDEEDGFTKVLPQWDDGFEGCWTWDKHKAANELELLTAKYVAGRWKIYRKGYANGADKMLKTILSDKLFHTEKGQKEFNQLFDTKDKIFQSPKSPYLVMQLLQTITADQDIVLDFFAGSGTAAHAVMALNAEDGSNRKFIVGQLPEPLDPNDKDQKIAANYCDALGKPRNIAEISKERIRRAGEKILADNAGKDGIDKLDVGFKVFKLDSTNIKPWDVDFDQLESKLPLFADSLKDDRSAEDVLYEILLKYGLDLSLPITTHTLAGKTVYNIGMGALVVCLDQAITLDTVEGIAKLKDELQPETAMRVVFRDSGFADDVVKVNAVQILKQAGIDDVRSV